MNWEAMSSIAEVVGAIAVVASLVFVGIQLKSNTKALRLSFTNGAVASFKESLSRLAEDEQVSEILFRGVPDADALEGLDLYRFTLQIQAYFLDYSNFYLHYRSGALDEETFEALDSQMRNFCNTPGLSAYWRRSGNNYPARFREYMDNSVLGNLDPLWLPTGMTTSDPPNNSFGTDA